MILSHVDKIRLLQSHIELLKSAKFRKWHVEPFKFMSDKTVLLTAEMIERHYSPAELAKTWGVSVQTIRDIFKNESGVLKIGRDGTRHRRRYKTLRIPESIAEKVHGRLSE